MEQPTITVKTTPLDSSKYAENEQSIADDLTDMLEDSSSGLHAAALGGIACRVLPASAVARSRQETPLYPHVAARLTGVAMCSVAHVQCSSASAEPSHLAQRLAVGQLKPGQHHAPLTTRLRARLAAQRQ